MADESFKEFVEDQLHALGAVSVRRMFGGYGLYRGARFFGILHRGRLYFKTDAQSRRHYLAHGMLPFRPNPRQTLASYYEVPAAILEDAEELVTWARRAVGVGPASPRARGVRRPTA
jgi:DNA transformation protein